MFKLSVPNDFLHLAMLQLSNSGQTNVLYNLAQGMGTLRQDKEDLRFPIKRIPMGLVESIYNYCMCTMCMHAYRTYIRRG